MVRQHNRQHGLTLIELAIVLLIVGLLALAATPLTSSWGANADLGTAAGQLDQAYAHARAVALRNEAGALGDDPAARIVHDPQTRELRVCRLPVGSCREVLWRSALPAGVVLSLQDRSFPVELNNRGQLLTPLSVQLTKGGVTDVHILQ